MEGDILKYTITKKTVSVFFLLSSILLFDACAKPATQAVANSADAEETSSTNEIRKDTSGVIKNASPTVSTPEIDSKEKDNPIETEEKKTIAIDAGHQTKGNYEEEPIGPGAAETKPKVSSGTQGVATNVPEYKLNLVIAKKIKSELINRCYEVFMIRDTNDVNISNKKRAEMAAESGADLFIRIHADSSTDADVNGTSTLYPSKDNPYVSNLSEDSQRLSEAIVNSICELTSSKNRGTIPADNMSGINWCTIPVSILEMGFMSNVKEDKLMQTEEYQTKIVNGICNGIDEYYQKTGNN
jgi:N-acetylmuramoyl-L-alanine amidase